MLPPNTVALAAGVTAKFASTRAAETPLGTGDSREGARDAGEVLANEPGVSPVVQARVGIAGHNEGGLSFSGKMIRASFRHAVGSGHPALSFGIGGSFGTSSGDTGDRDRGPPAYDARSFGFDVPVLFGWESDAGVVGIWAGVRAGMQRTTGTLTLPGATPMSGAASLTTWHAGAVAGLSVGFRHIHGVLEIEGTRAQSSGDVFGSAERMGTWIVTPSGGLVFSF